MNSALDNMEASLLAGINDWPHLIFVSERVTTSLDKKYGCRDCCEMLVSSSFRASRGMQGVSQKY
jgi:hypothetical protein